MEIFRDSRFSVIYDSQKIFRILLDSMARPGKVNRLPPVDLRVPGKSNRYVMAALRTLLDQQVSFCVLTEDRPVGHAIEQYLVQNTGSSVSVAGKADFVYAVDGDTRGQVSNLKRGRAEFPEEGATIVYGVQSLVGPALRTSQNGESGSRIILHLSGPGIQDQRDVSISGVTSEEIGCLTQARAPFPLGVDAIFVDAIGNILGLPRTTDIKIQR